ncbi:hypothetical protein HanIR_Chr14g0724071 [Helianthus annuus]|nr:hypothetical protein HanIR_Chr14g0724071 [Helianthus annuus]
MVFGDVGTVCHGGRHSRLTVACMKVVVFFLVFVEITSVFNMVAIVIRVVALTVALPVISRDGGEMGDGVRFEWWCNTG